MHFLKEQKRKGKEEDETEGQGESFEHWETITWGGGGHSGNKNVNLFWGVFWSFPIFCFTLGNKPSSLSTNFISGGSNLGPIL